MLDLAFDDIHDPDYCDLNVWIGSTATREYAVEITVNGALYMQSESLSCTLSKQDALKLAEAIQNYFKNNS